ncbi:CPBP family intramembrane glutamic endopeptidase [Hymenobacter cheonanensis]|uniref:CPBP family intramembrane glutamic endopeptidase n=1 Tax=Hymenobacter sp. CA2-7 TaxID=3063993 RepID=UPI0027122FF0|nr:type II CAAX endopeptidase family protein [Hymenobacter sp. CA2-7]MDO7885190.1 type II CAAX endopeptidase family protein [Hymenobacter sp. CA2-7]
MEPEPVDALPVAFPTLRESWGVLGWFLVISLVVGVPLYGLAAWLLPLQLPLYKLSVGALLSVVVQLVLLGWLRRRTNLVRLPSLRWNARGARWQLYALLLVLVPAQAVVLAALHLLPLPSWTAKTFQSMAHYPLLSLGFGCLLAPVLEEILFRGILLRGLLRNYSPALAIGQSALLFGIIHFNPAQSLFALCFGLTLGWIYYRTQSLVLCIVLHGLNNLLSFFSLMHNSAAMSEAAQYHYLTSSKFLYTFLGAAFLMGSLLWWIKRTTSPPAVEGLEK